MAKDKKVIIENIFNSPMLLRNWAVNLIGSLGNSAIQQKADTDKVDELITQFVEDYNFHYENLYIEQDKNEEE